jgi:hypothetical protein
VSLDDPGHHFFVINSKYWPFCGDFKVVKKQLKSVLMLLFFFPQFADRSNALLLGVIDNQQIALRLVQFCWFTDQSRFSLDNCMRLSVRLLVFEALLFLLSCCFLGCSLDEESFDRNVNFSDALENQVEDLNGDQSANASDAEPASEILVCWVGFDLALHHAEKAI